MDLTNVDAWTNSGGALSIIANRLSYFLDFRGPSVTVDTACSSSIVALHLACQSLRIGDSDVALAAGVNLMLAPSVVRAFDQTGALSADRRMPRVRRRRRRVHPRRGLWRRRAQAPERRRARRRSGAGGGAGLGGEPGRPVQRPAGAQPRRPDGGAALGLRQRGSAAARSRLRRGARHRNAAGRPDRSTRARHRAGTRSRRRRTAADRYRQDQPRPPGGRCRHCGSDQDRAGGARRQHPAEPALPHPQPAHPLRPVASESGCRATGLAGDRSAAPGGRLVVRFRWHQRARGDRAGAPGPTGDPRGRPGRDDAGGVGQVDRADLLAGPLAGGMAAGRRCPGATARRGAHPQPPPRAPRPVRHGVRPRPRAGRGPVAGAGRRPIHRWRRWNCGPARRAVQPRHGVRVLRPGLTLGRNGPPTAGRRAGIRRGDRRAGPDFR